MFYLRAIRENPLKAFNTHDTSKTIYGVWSNMDGTAYCVAESGTIFFFNGSSVDSFYLDPGVDFYDIFGFSRDDAIAVGTYGSIYRFNGAKWSKMESPTQNWLEAVWGFGPDDFYVAGDEGTVFHYSNGTWEKIRTGIRNRLYSIAGISDGSVYISGSFGTVLKISGEKVKKIPTNTGSHLLGIQKMPGSDKIIACGSEGALFVLENNRVTPVNSGVLSSLYGLDAASDNDVMIVGWRGVALRYDGKEVVKQNLGENSFMEGVVHIGGGKYLAAGWYGRIMTFSKGDEYWQTYQTGRAEKTLSVSINSSGTILGTTDTGNIFLKTKKRKKKRVVFVHPVDLNVSTELSGSRFLVGGDRGFFVRVEQKKSDLKIFKIETGTKKNILCHTVFGNRHYFSGQDGILFRASSQKIYLNERFGNIVKSRDVFSIAFADKANIYILGFRKMLKVVNLDTGKITDQFDGEKVESLFGRNGSVFCIKDGKLLSLNGAKDWDVLIEEPGKFFPTAGENPVVGNISSAGDIIVGGSRGGLILIKPGENPVSFHSGAYRFINSIDNYGDMYAAGVSGGRVVGGSLQSPERYSVSMSAPAYYKVIPVGNQFVFAGEASTIGIFKPGLKRAKLISAERGDFLSILKAGEKIVCAGAGIMTLLKKDGKIEKKIVVDQIISALADNGNDILAGTTNGSVLGIKRDLLLSGKFDSSDFISIIDDLGSPVIDIVPGENQTRIVLENGKVLLDNDPKRPLIHFTEHKLTSPSGSSADDAFYVAGTQNFLCRVDSPKISVFDPPERVYSVLLHGSIGLGDYWFGGSSGTLLFRANDKWYKVHTGIGNRLYSIAYNGERICVCGAYGAVRIDRSDFIEKIVKPVKIEELHLDIVAEPEVISTETPSDLPMPHINQSFYLPEE